MSLDDQSRKTKRIVLEHVDGVLSWRFVPRARLAPDVQSEGTWPRVIVICGEPVEISEDQWDIYKLDPHYDCFVSASPALTTITKAASPPPSSSGPTQSAFSSNSSKRGLSPESAVPADYPIASGSKSKRKIEVPVFNVDAEEQESMLVDEDEASRRAAASERSRKLREAINKERQERRERMARRDEKLSHLHEKLSNLAGTYAPPNLFGNGNGQSSTQNKRKVSSNQFHHTTQSPERRSRDDSDDSDPRESATFVPAQGNKRARTLSPRSAKRDLEAKRLERERRKKEKQEQKLQDWRQSRHDRLMKETLQGFSSETQNGHGQSIPTQPNVYDINDEDLTDDDDDDDDPQAKEEAARREALIASSRMKLAQLEEDRPLWEAAARERLAQEEAQEAAARQAAEDRRAQAAAERKEAERQAAEQRRREEQRQREKEDALRREREVKKKQQQRFAHGPWTTQRALERYRTLCEAFDATKFSPAQPLTFEEIPWPVLKAPFSYSVEDIEWAAVEDFFKKVKSHLRGQDYKVLVEKSHRRFHPDRWRARGLLTSIADEEERGCIEVAANCVAQALTPIWSSAKQRP